MSLKRKHNNLTYEFPEGTTEEQINEYFNQLNPEENRGLIKDIGVGAIDGVRDGIQATIGLVEQLGDTLGEKTNIGGIAFGKDAEENFLGLPIDFVSYEEMKERGLKDPIFGKAGVKDAYQLPETADPERATGNITKGMTQFLTGWFSGGKLLKVGKAGLKQNVVRGAVADFQAFDEDTGRLVDIVNEHAPALQNPLFEYLASDENDSFYEARFKNALEGAGLGGAIEGTLRGFRWYKNKKQQAKGEPYNKKQLAEDEKVLNESNIEELITTPKKYKPIKDDVSKDFVKNLDKDLEDGIFNSFRDAQIKFKKGEIKSRDFDNILQDLDISYNFNIKQMLDLDKGGLISEQAFAKAFSKLIKDKKVVLTDEQVESMARQHYHNKPNVLEKDIVELADAIRNAPATVIAMNTYRNFLNNSMKRLANLSSKEPKAKKLIAKIFLPKLKLVNDGKASISSNIARTQRLQATASKSQIAIDQENIIKEFETIGGDFDEFVRKIGASGNADVSKVIDVAFKNKTWDIANEFWINALLSNPKTHIINMSSNLFNMFIRPLEKSIGSQLILGNSSKARLLREEGKKALGTYVSMGRYLKDAIKYSGIALRKEDGILTARSKLDTPKKAIQKTKLVDGEEVLDDSISGKLINTAGKVVRIPSRFLMAEDEFFKQIQYRTHLERWAVDKAIKNNKSTTKIVATDIRTKQPITEFQQAVVDNFESGFTKDGRARIKSVLQMAEEGTYTNELSGIFKRISDTTNEYPVLKQILPFTRTPVNLMLNVVDRTPLGFVRKQFRDDFFGRNGAERMAQARGGLATGFGLIVLADMMTREGKLTGVQGNVKGEKTTQSRELKDLSKGIGRVPYAYRYWDSEEGIYKYREFGRFDPFGAFFGLVVDFHNFYEQANEEEALRLGSNIMLLTQQQGGDVSDYLSAGTKAGNFLSAMGSSMSRNLASKTYLKGLSDFMEVITDDDPAKWGRYAKSKAGSFIPNIYTKLINDPFYRDTRSILDELKRRSGTAEVEMKYDFRGNALKIQGDETERFINGVFNPFAERKGKNDPVASEVIRLGENISGMKTAFKGDIDLTLFTNKKGQTAYNRQQELLRKIRINGLSLDQRLQIAITSSGYKQLSEPRKLDKINKDVGGKVKLLRQITKEYHNAVEEILEKEAQNFTSVEDDTGTFTLLNSMEAVNNNISQLKMGIKINNSDINSLYQWSK